MGTMVTTGILCMPINKKVLTIEFPLGINWRLLRDQKLAVLQCINSDEDELLQGVLHLLDYLQDTAVDTGQKTKLEVFGEVHE